MPFHNQNGIRYFTFSSLTQAGIEHAIFTRRGGVSPGPWTSLNVGGTVGDDPARVVQNRHKAFLALQRHPETIYDVWQVHSREVVCVDQPRLPDQQHQRADAILTDRPGVSLFMRFADCVPILIADPRQGAVGLVHAGWKGTTLQVVAAAVQKMQDQYGSKPADIVAGIGPSIGAHHYPVGQDVIEEVVQTFGSQASKFLSALDGGVWKAGNRRAKFDLWAANKAILEESGVNTIEVAGICTACHTDDWYSHRAEQGQTGRFGAIIGLGK
jgi:YfiH family protein